MIILSCPESSRLFPVRERLEVSSTAQCLVFGVWVGFQAGLGERIPERRMKRSILHVPDVTRWLSQGLGPRAIFDRFQFRFDRLKTRFHKLIAATAPGRVHTLLDLRSPQHR
jgi:hypothetical protein